VSGLARAWGGEIRPGELSTEEDKLARRLERESTPTPAGRLPHARGPIR
jgi:hypothetical protein